MEEKTTPRALGESIRRRREELGLTQDQLARRLGYRSRSTINKIEKGVNDITQTKIEAFAAALATTPAELTGWDGAAPRPELLLGSGATALNDVQFALALEARELDEGDLNDVLDFIKFLRSKKKKKKS